MGKKKSGLTSSKARSDRRTRLGILREVCATSRFLPFPFTYDQYVDAGGRCEKKEIMKHFERWEILLQCVRESTEPTLRDKIMEVLQKPVQFAVLCEKADCKPSEARDILKRLKDEGINLIEDRGNILISKTEIIKPDNKVFKEFISGFIRKGFVSDTHLGSKYQQLLYLNDFYAVCEEMNVDEVFHCGDLTDGNGKVYKGHAQEIHVHGYENTVDYVVEQYPMRGNVKTRFIGGNHDESFFKSDGANICEAIEARRPDMEYLGMHGAYIQLAEDCKMYLHHPTGGRCYALSYKPQRLAEGFQPHNKPNIYCLGHWHGKGYFTGGRNIEVFTIPCFQSQTPLFVKHNWMPDVGGMILDMQIENGRLEAFLIHMFPYKVMIERDY